MMTSSCRLFFIFGLALMAALTASKAEAQSVDRIVAVVNGEIITMRQLDNRVSSLMKTKMGAGSNRAEMRKKVLDALIDQELINQAAKAKGVFVAEADVSAAIEAIKKDNNLTDAQFRASLAQNGTSMEAFRDDLRVELLRNRVLGSKVISRIVVTDSEVLTFLSEGTVPSAGGGDNRLLRLIVIPLDPKKKSQSIAEARKIKKEIEGGLSFAEAAEKYSKGPGRDNGGDPGDGMSVATLPPPLQRALATLKPGQPSEPVEAGNAVVIFTVADSAPSNDGDSGKKSKKDRGSLDDYGKETIENARRMIEQQKMKQRYTEWVDELKRNARIQVNL